MSTEETTQPGIVGEIVSEFHKLEEKVEHLIHPDAAVQSPPVDNGHVEAGAEQFTSALVVNEGNATEAPATLSNSSAESPSGSTPADEDPNVGALTAGTSSASDTPSSAAVVSQNNATQATSAFASLADDALRSIKNLRRHLWTFEYSAVATLHADLDKLELIFK
ncbi:hypothetical protein [Ralstonia insidiosa]|uniref:Uncharacterized protein n=1 Tax=Ralstonia insidiosa TaxID=190721 RepID=A0A848NUU1_9RALS|nr:hypothetical protein [Ralstonia insidiosa]NMV36937.1 hypothetical protein [Ralstonia insidiosa]